MFHGETVLVCALQSRRRSCVLEVCFQNFLRSVPHIFEVGERKTDKTIKILVIIVLAMTAVILGWFIFSIVVGPYLAMQSARQSMDDVTGKVGKAIQIQSLASDGTVWVQNVGDSQVTLADIYVNGTILTSSVTWSPSEVLDAGDTSSCDTYSGTYVSGDKVVVKVTTTDGTFIEYTKTF